MSFLRRALLSVESALLSSRQALGMKLNLPEERMLFEFNKRDSIASWISSSDQSIGGSSECTWEMYAAEDEEPSHPSESQSTTKEEQEQSARSATNIPGTYLGKVRIQDNVPSAVFSGNLSLACTPMEAGIVRSGYCGVRGILPKGMHLHGYEGLAMRVMTDGRLYRVNAQMDSWNPMDLYMGFIKTPPNKWVEIELAFEDFIITSKGYYKVDEGNPLNPTKLRRLGFAIADEREGPFELRVQWIKAVQKIEEKPQQEKIKRIRELEIQEKMEELSKAMGKTPNQTKKKADDLAI